MRRPRGALGSHPSAPPAWHQLKTPRGWRKRLVLYRAGRVDAAVQRLNEAITGHGEGGVVEDWLFLAMAYHQLKRPQEARRWLEKATSWLDRNASRDGPVAGA